MADQPRISSDVPAVSLRAVGLSAHADQVVQQNCTLRTTKVISTCIKLESLYGRSSDALRGSPRGGDETVELQFLDGIREQ